MQQLHTATVGSSLVGCIIYALGLELFYLCVYVYCFLLSFFCALCVCVHVCMIYYVLLYGMWA